MPDRDRAVTARGAVASAPGRPSREPLLRHVIGGILRAERTRQGRTLLEVAQAARVSMPYLSEVERGRKEASSEILAAVTAALGLRLVDVVARAQTELSVPVAVRTLRAVTEPVTRSTAAGSATLLAA